MRSVLAGAALICLSACATAPESIEARPANVAALGALSCGQLEAQQASVGASLSEAESAQRRTRRADMVGVALVFVPIGSLTGGNHARQIGDLKGQRDALQSQIEEAKCYGAAAADAPISVNSSARGS